MLVIELNEFNPNYLKRFAKKLKLRNILYFLNLEHSETYTKDKKEHHGLDPWVQWVSIHSGLPFSKHKISRLGQTKEVADTIYYLCSDQSSYVSGAEIEVNGGQHV